MKALIIGCGRVGSSIALQLQSEGWDVVVVDENEDALSRLGDHWPGTFLVGHGIDTDLLREAGIEDADAVVAATDGDNTNIVIGEVAEKRFDVKCVVVRVLDPARAEFYAARGHAHGLPDEDRDRHAPRDRPAVRDPRRQDDRLMYVVVAGAGKVGANVARSLLRLGHEVTLIEQRSDRFERLEDEFEHQVQRGDATELHVLEHAGLARPPDIVLALTGDDEDNMVICQLAKEKYGVPKVIARVNDPRNQAAFRPARHLADGLRDLEHHGARRARGSGARSHPPARAAQGEPRDRRGADRPRLAVGGQAGRRRSSCPRERA